MAGAASDGTSSSAARKYFIFIVRFLVLQEARIDCSPPRGWKPAALEIGSSSCTRALTRKIATMHGTAIKLDFKTLNSD